MPAVLGAGGVEAPGGVDGASQQPFDGASFAASFDDADAPAARQVQYFEMLGSRSIGSGDWKATTNHVSEGVVDEEELMEGSRDFAEDRWALFDLTTDFSEATDVAADHPDVVRRLEQQWLIEARSEEHTSELQSLMRISYAVFCLTKKNQNNTDQKLITLNYPP